MTKNEQTEKLFENKGKFDGKTVCTNLSPQSNKITHNKVKLRFSYHIRPGFALINPSRMTIILEKMHQLYWERSIRY